MPRKRYTGILAKPMEPGEGLDAFAERIVALYRHYDVDPGPESLAFLLYELADGQRQRAGVA